MYYCSDCNIFFEEPSSYSEDRTPGGAFEGGSFIEHYSGCPNCGCGYEEAHHCDMCADAYVRESEDICDSCKQYLLKEFLETITTEELFDEFYDIWYKFKGDDYIIAYKGTQFEKFVSYFDETEWYYLWEIIEGGTFERVKKLLKEE